MDEMRGKTCVVTGASMGIGRSTAAALAAMGADVLMVSRHPERAEAARAVVARGASGNVDVLLADLSSQQDLRRLAGEIRTRCARLDVLVNNAGALYTSRQLSPDGVELTFAMDHLSYFLLTHELLDLLKKSAPARIVNVSSRAHEGAQIDFEHVATGGRFSPRRAYHEAKLANVLFTYELARRLEGTGVTANCLHPGVVRTGFGKNNTGLLGYAFAGIMHGVSLFFISPEEGAKTSVHLASSPDVERVTGKYFARSREAPSSPASHDADAAQKLWRMSEELTGIAAASPA